jgi:hypothetical protein
MEAAGSSFNAVSGFIFHRRDINMEAVTRTSTFTVIFYIDISSKEFFIDNVLREQQ